VGTAAKEYGGAVMCTVTASSLQFPFLFFIYLQQQL
jgi:hypothetical protein